MEKDHGNEILIVPPHDFEHPAHQCYQIQEIKSTTVEPAPMA